MSSSGKRRGPEDKFHIQYPAARDFLTWVEVGCLSRALGFPPDMVCSHVNEEIEIQENGITVEQLHRMMDLKLLHQALHRSFNMHTADWNLCVIKKAVRFLHINLLSFEDLHSIRIAYATYEASDMKGLNLDKRSLLRTLKMCQRIISPKKLMHRVKHMKPSLEENDRIQLYELFDLILWCDTAENGPKVAGAEEIDNKDNELYNMVDFETLLSHQDERQSRVLDQRYLAEEWDFGRERLGDKRMFKGEVVYTDQRVSQTQTQKKRYRRLKRAVSNSQRQVYRALAGSIRHRPISAPSLSEFSTARDTPNTRPASVSAVYKSVQRRLHSAPSATSKPDISDRPTIPEYHRVHTPCVITSHDLDDVTLKMQNLEFDIFTLGSRCQVKKEEEMNFYIPDYEPSLKESNSDGVEQVAEKKREHWTAEIIDNLAYPAHPQSPHHTHACDARLRGWKPSTYYGPHRVLTAPTLDSTPHGKLLAKQRAVMMAPVANMHKDYVIRYTSKKEAREAQNQAHRPCTAPAASPRTPHGRQVKRLGCKSAGSPRKASLPRSSTEADSVAAREDHDKLISESGARGHEAKDTDQTSKTHDDDTNAEISVAAGKAPGDAGLGQAEKAGLRAADKTGGSGPRAAAAANKMPNGLPLQQEGGSSSSRSNKPAAVETSSASSSFVLSSSSSNNTGRKREEEDISGISMRNTRSKVVEVGGMGTIQLLESIQEHDGEDRLGEISTMSASSLREVTGGKPASRGDTVARLLPQCVLNDNSAKQRSEAPEDSRLFRQDVQKKQTKEADAMPTIQGRAAAADNSSRTNYNQFGFSQNQKPNFPLFSANTESKPPMGPQRVKIEKPATVAVIGNKEKPPLGLPRQQQQQQQQPQRVGSAASSTTVSDSSDSREPPLTPLTSITVTVKNKDQHVSSSTRLNDINDSGGEGGHSLSNSFNSSRPCVTSTPRRGTKPSPVATPRRSARSGHAKSNAHTTITKKPTAQGREHRNGSASSLPLSDISSPSQGRSPDIKLSWTNDRILAMNAAFEKPIEPVVAEAGGDRHAADILEENSMEDVATWIERSSRQQHDAGERKKSIQFSADTKDHAETKPPQKQPSEEKLLSSKFDLGLNAETPRRFTFNNATTRRLLERVHDVISPELRTRIKTGNTGLTVN